MHERNPCQGMGYAMSDNLCPTCNMELYQSREKPDTVLPLVNNLNEPALIVYRLSNGWLLEYPGNGELPARVAIAGCDCQDAEKMATEVLWETVEALGLCYGGEWGIGNRLDIRVRDENDLDAPVCRYCGEMIDGSE